MSKPIRSAFSVEGEGEPIFLIHGIGASRHSFDGLVAALKSEYRCIGYDLHESVTRPGTFVFVERWEDRDALTAHMNAEHFKVWRKAGAEGITSRRIEIISDGKVEVI